MERFFRAYHLNKKSKSLFRGWLKAISSVGTVLLIAAALLGCFNSVFASSTGLMTYGGSEDTPAYRQYNGSAYGPESAAQGTTLSSTGMKAPFVWVVCKSAPSWISNISKLT